MGNLRLINSNIFPLQGTNGRFIHTGTILKGIQEFMCFIDKTTSVGYIEEVTGGHLELIEDDHLHAELSQFAIEKDLFAIIKDNTFIEIPTV